MERWGVRRSARHRTDSDGRRSAGGPASRPRRYDGVMGHGVDENSTRERLDAVGAVDVAATLQALATPSRLRILARLQRGPVRGRRTRGGGGPRAVRVLHRCRLLRNLGLVTGERRGRSIVYALYDDHVAELLEQALHTWSTCGWACGTRLSRRPVPAGAPVPVLRLAGLDEVAGRSAPRTGPRPRSARAGSREPVAVRSTVKPGHHPDHLPQEVHDGADVVELHPQPLGPQVDDLQPGGLGAGPLAVGVAARSGLSAAGRGSTRPARRRSPARHAGRSTCRRAGARGRSRPSARSPGAG